jgi:hypothetical protein
MARIEMNPREAVEFSRHLQQIAVQIRLERDGTERAFRGLRDRGWDDRRFAEYSISLESSMRELDVYVEKCGQYSEYLYRKAEALEKYLNRR